MENEPLEMEPWWLVPRRHGGNSDKLVLPTPIYNRYRDPKRYDPGKALISAVNVALLLGQPLLLAGAPGCGKTSLAYWLASNLGLNEPLVHFVKSSTTGRDLLYQFDDLARFRDAQGGPSHTQSMQNYLQLTALGQAILFSAGPDAIAKPLAGARALELTALSFRDLYTRDFPRSKRQVVLIDELDKAPSDTPNDLLNEIERMEFRIPELGVEISGDPENRPIVVITTNSDKPLPEPFLRRCVYHHIPTPDFERRGEIIGRRVPPLAMANPALYDDALLLIEELRQTLGRNIRQPGTAEMLSWIDTLHHVYPPHVSRLRDDPERLGATVGVLAKTEQDRELVRRFLGLDG